MVLKSECVNMLRLQCEKKQRRRRRLGNTERVCEFGWVLFLVDFNHPFVISLSHEHRVVSSRHSTMFSRV